MVLSRRQLLGFFLLAYGITWGVGGLALLLAQLAPSSPLTSSNPLYFVAAWGPTIAGLIVTWRVQGSAGVSRLVSRAVPRVSRLIWYVAVLIGFPVVAFVSGWIVDADTTPHVPSLASSAAIVATALFTDPGPLGEELGWRGVALPSLLSRRTPLGASLVLGLIWASWHLPTFFIGTLVQSQFSPLLFFVGAIALTVVMTALYRRTGGDLALMILVHLITNVTMGMLGISFLAEVIAESACAVFVVSLGWLRASPVRVS